MTLEKYLSQYAEFFTIHLKDGCSQRKESIVLSLSILKEIEICYYNIKRLNEYIYNNYFYDCLEYLDIKDNSLKELILNQYHKTSFEDHNIISRLDLFFTKKGIQIAEINHDTPGGWIETYFLNQIKDLPVGYFDPNKRFAELLGNAFVRRGISDIFLLTGIGSRLDKKMISFFGKILDYYQIVNKIGIFEGIIEKNGELYSGTKRIVNIHRDIPIDRLCNNYNQYITSILLEKIKNNTIIMSNNPVGYIFQMKSYFAFLYENIIKFPFSIQEIVYSYIPNTRRINIKEKKYFQKKDRVIKHVNKRLGQGVHIGVKTTEKEWIKLIENSNNNWIIQEYFDVLPIINKYINFGVYGIDGSFGGVYTRISSLSNKTTETDDYTCPLFFQ